MADTSKGGATTPAFTSQPMALDALAPPWPVSFADVWRRARAWPRT